MDKSATSEYISKYLDEVKKICEKVDKESILDLAFLFNTIKRLNGRIFVVGVGGSAANASHCVNDFRKILGIESYSPSDNVAELTARINDESWESSYVDWLKTSKIRATDLLLVLSVGGGSEHTSKNLVESIKYAKSSGAFIGSIVSRDGGFAKENSDACVLIPIVVDSRITPHAEEWQGVIWHLITNLIHEN